MFFNTFLGIKLRKFVTQIIIIFGFILITIYVIKIKNPISKNNKTSSEVIFEQESFNEILLKKRKKPPIKVKNIPLNQSTNWLMKKGNYIHKSGEFFKVNALRVSETRSREVDKWDQPILTQIGYDGGILGLIRKRFFGVPHYLIEAKLEPGNYKFVQLSPTLQATFSNLRRVHRGRKPYFEEYFDLKRKKSRKVLYKQWLSEDGGRLNKKRNLGIIIEIPEKIKLKISKDFIWMSMWQIKECLKYNAWVNPHVRGLISCL